METNKNLTPALLTNASELLNLPLEKIFSPDQLLELGDKPVGDVEITDYIAKLMDMLEKKVTEVTVKEKALTAARKQLEKLGETFELTLKKNLRDVGLAEIRGRSFMFSIHDAGARALTITDPKLLPKKYVKDVVTTSQIIDNAKIKADLLAGKKVKGAKLEDAAIVLKKKAITDGNNQIPTIHDSI